MKESSITFRVEDKSFRIIREGNDFKVQKTKVLTPSRKLFRPLSIFKRLYEMMFIYTNEIVEVLEEKKLI